MVVRHISKVTFPTFIHKVTRIGMGIGMEGKGWGRGRGWRERIGGEQE